LYGFLVSIAGGKGGFARDRVPEVTTCAALVVQSEAGAFSIVKGSLKSAFHTGFIDL